MLQKHHAVLIDSWLAQIVAWRAFLLAVLQISWCHVFFSDVDQRCLCTIPSRHD